MSNGIDVDRGLTRARGCEYAERSQRHNEARARGSRTVARAAQARLGVQSMGWQTMPLNGTRRARGHGRPCEPLALPRVQHVDVHIRPREVGPGRGTVLVVVGAAV